MSVLNFSEGYRQYFEVVPAQSESLKREAFRLRHDVYCRDLGFEPCSPDGLETDRYDRHSLHCLVRALGSGMIVGGARLVLVNPEAPQAPLPFEALCGTTAGGNIAFNGRPLDRFRIAEISRLAVLGRYRRRRGEEDRPFAMDTMAEGSSELRLPYLPVALYLALLALARKHDIVQLFALLEPRLAKSINRLGGNLVPFGDAISHRGQRIACSLEVGATIESMNPFVRDFFELIANELDTFCDEESKVPDIKVPLLRA